MFEKLELQETDIEGLSFSALQSLKAAEKLNTGIELDYRKDDYPAVDDMLSFLRENKDKEPVKISLDELSVNGVCIQDEMNTYLSTKKISSGNLKEALKTPLAFFYDFEKTFEEKDKSHFELGTFAHMAFLEPELFDKVVVAPEVKIGRAHV